jgi:2-polyprenyl-3-methyl-5-hydroxy-6-metoxy-1,4-benzoquinol methylase
MGLDRDFVDHYFRRRPDVLHWWRPENGVFRSHYERELRVIERILDAAPRGLALDYGTGQGRVARLLAKHGYRVLALDVNAFMLAEAKRRSSGLPIDYAVAASNALRSRELVRVVTLVEVMDHLPASDEVLADLVANLQPDGLLILTVVSAESLYGRLADAVRRRVADQSLKVARTYRLDALERILGALGLTVDFVYGVGLLSLPVRPGARWIGLPLALLARCEGMLLPYVEARPLVRLCTTVVLGGRKVGRAPSLSGPAAAQGRTTG